MSVDNKLTHRELVDDLLEKLEDELEEFSNAELSALLDEYENSQFLTNIVEGLEIDEEDDIEEENDEDVDNDDLPLIDDAEELDDDEVE